MCSNSVENAILGAVLNDPKYCRPFIRNLKPEYFYSIKSQTCFKAILELYKNEVYPDIITLGNYLRKIGKFDNVLGSWDT
ncbi:MAG: DnaB-like helicase N-terminal domain-containing protein, partial [Promethearchaeota archaeon]